MVIPSGVMTFYQTTVIAYQDNYDKMSYDNSIYIKESFMILTPQIEKSENHIFHLFPHFALFCYDLLCILNLIFL